MLNRSLALTLKMAMPQVFVVVTVKRAGPGWPDGNVTLLLAAVAPRIAAAFCNVIVSIAALSVGSAINEPPPLKSIVRPLVEPLMRKLPALRFNGLPATMSPTTASVVSLGTVTRLLAKVADDALVKLPPMKVRPSTSELVDRLPRVMRSYC